MLGGGHFITAGTLAAASSKRLGKPFPALAALAVLVNDLDLDHLFNYRLDDGTANSLTLHPAHLYGGVLIFALFLVYVISDRWGPWALMALGAWALHLAADAYAYALGYSIPLMMGTDVVLFGIGYLVLKRTDIAPKGRVLLYWLVGALLLNGTHGFIDRILDIGPQESLIPWTVPHLVNIALAIGYLYVFPTKKQSGGPENG